MAGDEGTLYCWYHRKPGKGDDILKLLKIDCTKSNMAVSKTKLERSQGDSAIYLPAPFKSLILCHPNGPSQKEGAKLRAVSRDKCRRVWDKDRGVRVKYPLLLYSARHEGLIVFSDRRARVLDPHTGHTLFKAYLPDFGGEVEVAWFGQDLLLVKRQDKVTFLGFEQSSLVIGPKPGTVRI